MEKYRAILETRDGQRIIVLPTSKKTGLFRSLEAAMRALEQTRTPGRGLIVPTGRSLDIPSDRQYIITVAL